MLYHFRDPKISGPLLSVPTHFLACHAKRAYYDYLYHFSSIRSACTLVRYLFIFVRNSEITSVRTMFTLS